MILNYIRNFIKYFDLLIEMTKNHIKLKYTHSFLGVFWSMLNPLLMMIVLTIIFSTLFKNNIDNYPVYVLSGRLIYSFFAEATNTAMTSIQGSISLVKKVYVPKYIFPLSRVCSSFVNLLISFVPLVLVAALTGVKFSVTSLEAIFPLIYLFFISLGLGLILATISVFYGDVQHLYSVILMVLMYFSAIFYPVSILPPEYLPLIELNPIFTAVVSFRDCVMYNTSISVFQHLRMLIYSVVYMSLGLFVFYKKQDQFVLNL